MTALRAASSQLSPLKTATSASKKRALPEETKAELIRKGAVGRRFAVVGLPANLAAGLPSAKMVRPAVDQAELAAELARLGFSDSKRLKISSRRPH